MSDEFKKEKMNPDAAGTETNTETNTEMNTETRTEETKTVEPAAEKTVAEPQGTVEAENSRETAEAPKDREEKKATTYSWVNPKISGKTGEENNSASYTGRPEQNESTGEAKTERTASEQKAHYQYQSQTQNRTSKAEPKFSAIPQPQDHKKKAKKPMSTAKKWGMTLAMAACFGLVAGGVFLGTAAVGTKVISISEKTEETTIPTTTTTKADSSDTADSGSDTATGAMSVKDVASSAMPSLVAISTTTVEEVQTFFGTTSQEVPASGTGVIVGQNDDELLIATNNHVVSGATSLSVSFIDDETVEGQIKGTDADNDLAVVAVKLSDIKDDTKNKIKVAAMGDSDQLEVGDQVVAIGNALGTGQSLTSGYVSAKDRTISSQDEATGETITSEGLIQTDAAINPGNSGGALLNMNGELIGINEAKYSSTQVEGMGFAIPISKAEPILQNLMNLTTRYKVSDDQAAYIGINMADVSADISQSYGIPTGVCIMSVVDGSPAADAGFKKGDVITSFDGRSVSNAKGLKETLSYYASGETVDVTVQRADNGEYKEVKLTLTLGSAADMPQTSGNGNNSGSTNGSTNGNGSSDESDQSIQNPFGNR